MKKFEIADEEFQPLLRQIFEDEKYHGVLNVAPEHIICMRCNGAKSKYTAYVRGIGAEYELLTNKHYFMVIMSATFDAIPKEKQMLAILHEYYHLYYDVDKERYVMRDHEIKDFVDLLKNPEENADLVKNYTYTNVNVQKQLVTELEKKMEKQEKKQEKAEIEKQQQQRVEEEFI